MLVLFLDGVIRNGGSHDKKTVLEKHDYLSLDRLAKDGSGGTLMMMDANAPQSLREMLGLADDSKYTNLEVKEILNPHLDTLIQDMGNLQASTTSTSQILLVHLKANDSDSADRVLTTVDTFIKDYIYNSDEAPFITVIASSDSHNTQILDELICQQRQDPVINFRKPRQSCDVQNGEFIDNSSSLRNKQLLVFIQSQPRGDSVRVDSINAFKESQIITNGSLGCISTRAVGAELAFRTGSASKYGA